VHEARASNDILDISLERRMACVTDTITIQVKEPSAKARIVELADPSAADPSAADPSAAGHSAAGCDAEDEHRADAFELRSYGSSSMGPSTATS